MRGQGRASRQVHLARESQWFWASGQEKPADHGSGGAGATVEPWSRCGGRVPGARV